MSRKKILLSFLIVAIVLFVEKCTPFNISTADVFRSKKINQSSRIFDKPLKFEHYEINPTDGISPILYDTIQNVFYLPNRNGLTKIDGKNGKIVLSDSLVHEERTSNREFLNYLPYVFTEEGVYDFSGTKMVYQPIEKIYNIEEEMSDESFKTLFENLYSTAEMVVYNNDRLLTTNSTANPMFFLVNEKWILLFSTKRMYINYKLSFSNYYDVKEVFGQVDVENFPAKFGNKKLIVLKDDAQGLYTTHLPQINDSSFTDDDAVVLNERNLDYSTTNKIKWESYKKLKYYSVGNLFDLPDFMLRTFWVKSFYSLHYNGDVMNFYNETYQHLGKISDKLYLYEVPKKFRNKTKISFIGFSDKYEIYMINPKLY